MYAAVRTLFLWKFFRMGVDNTYDFKVQYHIESGHLRYTHRFYKLLLIDVVVTHICRYQ